MKDAKEFWDKSALKYAKSPIKDKNAYQKKLKITQDYFQSDCSVLEFGCGTGSTALLHAPFVKHMTATDISDEMIEIAKQKAKNEGVKNISFKQETLDSLALDKESFDVVLGLNILHLIKDLDGSVSKVYELLKPGGVFVSSTELIGEINFFLRLIIPLMQVLNLAPYVNVFNLQAYKSSLARAGFTIEYEWQLNDHAVFLIAKKAG